MASFIKEVKKELIDIKNDSDCCALAFIYALILSSGSFNVENGKRYLELTTANEMLYAEFNNILVRMYGVDAELNTDEENMLNHISYLIKIPMENSQNLLSDLGILQNGDINLNFNDDIIANDCCKKSFLRALFLACANSSIKFNNNETTNSGYHLEFVLPNEKIGDILSSLLAELSIIERTVYRGNSVIVYLSDYDSILMLIGILGAHKSYLNLENENINRNINKEVNRQMNFVNANLSKQSSVAAKQILAIKEIDDIIKIESLPFELFEVAKARLENPELSLNDLITKLKTPISKSGIAHRMRKILEINKNLKN